MTIKEKARRYDEALEKAKSWYPDSQIDFKKSLENLFPELKESEDERIKKLCKELIESTFMNELCNKEERDTCIAWLEKQGEQKLPIEKLPSEMKTIGKSLGFTTQEDCDRYNQMVSDLIMSDDDKGEQKPADKVEPKFHEGEWLVNVEYGNVVRVLKVLEDNYRLDFGGDTIGTLCTELVDSDYRLWNIIQDAKDGDILVDYHEAYDNPLIFILKKFEHVNFGLVRPSDYSSYCFLTSGDIQRFKEGTYHHEHNIKPATKEQRDLLFQKMKEVGYEWDAEKKELKKIEQKPVQDEEDEKRIKDIIYFLDTAKKHYASTVELDACIDWLKSLRPQVHWKPTKEQMDALWRRIAEIKISDERPSDIYILGELYEQLENL